MAKIAYEEKTVSDPPLVSGLTTIPARSRGACYRHEGSIEGGVKAGDPGKKGKIAGPPSQSIQLASSAQRDQPLLVKEKSRPARQGSSGHS